MKRILFIIGAVIFLFTLCEMSYTEEPMDTVMKTESFDVKIPRPYFSCLIENLISTDRKNYDGKYNFYKTKILLKHYLNERDDIEVVDAINMFDNDKYTVSIDYTAEKKIINTQSNLSNKHNYIDDKELVFTFRQAYDKVMKSNFPKPHSKQVVLCKLDELENSHPYYIFGDIDLKIYVDATTGKVSNKNPH